VILNERDVIDVNYAYVPSDRKQSCEKVGVVLDFKKAFLTISRKD